MTEVFRKIGFDASQAISELGRLSEAVNSAGAVLDSFSRSRSFNLGGAGQGLRQAKDLLVEFQDGSKQAVGSLDDLVNSARRASTGQKPLSDALRNNAESAKAASSAFNRFAKSVGNILVVRAIIGALGAVSRAFRQSAEAAKEFQLAIAEIQTIGQSLGRTSEQISSQVLNLSSSLGSDAVDTARGLYQVLSNQVVEAGQAFQFLEQAQKLAITTVASTEDAVDALSSVMNAYNLDASDAARVSDTLFEAVNVGRFRLNEIANIIGRVTPLTAQMGITWEETAAAIAAMTQSGVRADTAITQLRAITVKLLKPTEALQELYRKWGVEDGPAAIRAFGGLQGVIEKITQETGGSNAELTKFFNEVRGLAGVLGLSVDDGERFAETLRQIQDSGGRAAEAFEGFQSSQVQQLVIETERFNNALIQLGTALIPLRTELARFGNEFFKNVALGVDVLFNSQNLSATASRAIAQGTEEGLKRSAEAREEFTALDGQEYKKQVQAARQAAAQISQEWARIFNAAQTQGKAATEVFQQFSKDIADIYKEELKGVDNFLKDINKTISDGRKQINSDQLAIDDERFNQELEKTTDSAARQKKILDRAYEEYWKARDQLNKGNLTKETQTEIREQFKRARELANQARSEDAFAGFNKQADELILESLQGRRDVTEKYIKEQEALVRPAEQLQQKLGENFQKATELSKQQAELASKVNEALFKGDDAAADRFFQDLQAVKAQLKDLALTSDEVDLLKRINPESAAKELNDRIQNGLDGATYNWLRAVTALQDQLKQSKFEFDAQPRVQELLGPDFKARAEAAGVDTSETQSDITKLDAVLQGAEKGAREFHNVTEDLNQALRNQGILSDSLKGEFAALDIAVTDFVRRQTPLLAKYRAAIFNLAGDKGRAAGSLLGSLTEDTRNDVIVMKSIVADLREAVKSDNVLTEDEASQIRERIKSAIGAQNLDTGAVDALNTALDTAVKASSDASKEVEDANKAAFESARANKQNLETLQTFDPLNTGLDDLKTKASETLNGIPSQIEPIKQGMTDTKNEANNAATAGASIGPKTASAASGIGQATAAMTALKNEAIAAAQAVAAAQSGAAVPAAKGRYFAAGGLGALRPLGTDTIPAMIQRGEFVTNAKASRKFFSELNAINQDKAPVHRREGGSVTQVGDINVTVQGGDTSRQTVRAIAVELNRELKRGTIRLGSLRKA